MFAFLYFICNINEVRLVNSSKKIYDKYFHIQDDRQPFVNSSDEGSPPNFGKRKSKVERDSSSEYKITKKKQRRRHREEFEGGESSSSIDYRQASRKRRNTAIQM